MSLRRQFGLYLIGIHSVFAATAAYAWWHDRIWLIGGEVFLLCSLWISLRLMYRMLAPLHLMRTGADLIAEADFSSRFSPTGQAEVDRLAAVYNGMADRLREERIRMEEQHFFLDKVLQVSPLGIVTFDYDGRIDMVNPGAERMLQMSWETLKGIRLCDVSVPLAQALAALSVGEHRIIPFMGQRRLRCERAHFLDRGFERQFILMEELTEELRQSEKRAYEHLIRMMSHEVNNSVGAVHSLLQSCLHYGGQISKADRADFETALRVAMDRTDHLNGFVKRFADVVRLPDPERRPCDVRQLLEDIFVLMQSECDRRGIAWVWDVQAPMAPIKVDKNQLEQVFVNVLKNAMEAIGKDGRITIRIGLQADRWFVAVEDTGPGIPPEVQEKLFAPFFSTKRDGQGIGLTLVQEILTRHEFDFSLEGPPGGPTRFTIWF